MEDRLEPLGGEILLPRVDVVHDEAEVMNPIALRFEELGIQVLTLQGLDELELDLIGLGEGDLDPGADRLPRSMAPSISTSSMIWKGPTP